MKIKVKKLNSDAVLPKYAKAGDAGMDIYAVSKNETEKYIEYGTGLSFELPSGFMMLLYPRSSVSNMDLVMANSVGVLDAGYRGELKVRFRKNGPADYNVGDRVAQIIIMPFPEIDFEETDKLTPSERGESGFGSTGNG